MKLWPHQQRIIDINPKKSLLCWEMRTGKTLPASMWGQKRPSCLVVCPKQLLKDWQKLMPTDDVLTKEQFKKGYKKLEKYHALIIEEAHVFGSPLFTRGRSQLSTAMYEFIKANPEMDVLLLTATPIRNDPSSLHTLLCFIGVFIPWKEWRARFYELKHMPYLPRPAYFPVKDWRVKIRPILEKYADIVSLQDVVDYLPPYSEEVVEVKPPKAREQFEKWTEEHLYEQTNKDDYIKTLGYRKILIVAHYTEQIDQLEKSLKSERPVFVMDGRSKDPTNTIKQAQESDECYFIVQASMGVGFDGYMFGAMVFASMSHSVVSHTQMFGRLRHLEHLKPLMYYYIIGGKWDKRIYESVKAGEDFNPHKYVA